MQFIHHLAILTPFQRSTRERIQSAMQHVAKRVQQERLSISKLACHREVLSTDLMAEGRDWQRAKKGALRAAQETLLSQQSSSSLSLQHPGEAQPATKWFGREGSIHLRPASTAESFHSALDFGQEWPSSDDITSSDFLGPIPPSHLPTPNGSDAFPPSPGDDPHTPDSDVLHFGESSPSRSHERFYTAQEVPDEEAEEWNKTRCAQRVSLVRVPSSFMVMSSRIER
jgi:hypothetical protein